MNSILGTYQNPNWNGFVTSTGQHIAPNQGSYQFDTSTYNAMANVQNTLKQLDERKTILTQQRDSLMASIASASDEATVHKLQTGLANLNAAIADVNQSESQAVNQARIQETQNNAARQILSNIVPRKNACGGPYER
jgi:hypothetical protein